MVRHALLVILLMLSACSSRVSISPSAHTASGAAVNINTASVDELERLPYIGRKTAEAIVVFREQNGPFRRVEHLLLIRGVSRTRFEELRHLIKVE